MALGDLKDILHKIKVKLFPNVEGKYIARTDSEATLSVEDICTASKNRGGFTGKFNDYVDFVNQFLAELIYQLLDGYAVNLGGYISIHPHIDGVFNLDKEIHDHKKHPVGLRFRILMKLRRLMEAIAVEVSGMADANGLIAEFTDTATGAVNEVLTKMNIFTITGDRIKIAGDHPDVGLYFEQTDGPAKIKVTDIAENTANKVIGMCPGAPAGKYKVVIKTQWTNSSSLLKEPRVIESSFTLT
ncbi:MAG: DUF4469 domain-containing protein [Treponema sp.]|jgi:hypothetical protein|nr:DUF4469 domain-containing protein [Treponema sp.]